MTPRKLVKVRFFTSAPQDQDLIRPDREFRAILEALRGAEFEEHFDLKIWPAGRPEDLAQLLYRDKPDILHISLHGAKKSLAMEDADAQTASVSVAAITSLLQLHANTLTGVILNSCKSDNMAEKLSETLGFVIGMKGSIDDSASEAFSVGFYQAIAYGQSIDHSFRAGQVHIQMRGMDSEAARPRLFCKKTPPENLVLTQEPALPAEVVVPSAQLLFDGLHANCGARFHGAGSPREMDEIDLILTNHALSNIQIRSMEGRWRTRDGKHPESALPLQQPAAKFPVLIAQEKSATFTFRLDPTTFALAGLDPSEYPMADGDPRAVHLLYYFLVEFADTSFSCRKVFLCRYERPNFKVETEEVCNPVQPAPSLRAKHGKFQRLLGSVPPHQVTNNPAHLTTLEQALLSVPGFWIDSVEESKRLVKVRLWTSYILDSYGITPEGIRLTKPENIHNAHRLFADDEIFMKAAFRHLNIYNDAAAFIYCHHQCCREDLDASSKAHWKSKARDHATNLRSRETEVQTQLTTEKDWRSIDQLMLVCIGQLGEEYLADEGQQTQRRVDLQLGYDQFPDLTITQAGSENLKDIYLLPPANSSCVIQPNNNLPSGRSRRVSFRSSFGYSLENPLPCRLQISDSDGTNYSLNLALDWEKQQPSAIAYLQKIPEKPIELEFATGELRIEPNQDVHRLTLSIGVFFPNPPSDSSTIVFSKSLVCLHYLVSGHVERFDCMELREDPSVANSTGTFLVDKPRQAALYAGIEQFKLGSIGSVPIALSIVLVDANKNCSFLYLKCKPKERTLGREKDISSWLPIRVRQL